jgi:hypothetical protein
VCARSQDPKTSPIVGCTPSRSAGSANQTRVPAKAANTSRFLPIRHVLSIPIEDHIVLRSLAPAIREYGIQVHLPSERPLRRGGLQETGRDPRQPSAARHRRALGLRRQGQWTGLSWRRPSTGTRCLPFGRVRRARMSMSRRAIPDCLGRPEND